MFANKRALTPRVSGAGHGATGNGASGATRMLADILYTKAYTTTNPAITNNVSENRNTMSMRLIQYRTFLD